MTNLQQQIRFERNVMLLNVIFYQLNYETLLTNVASCMWHVHSECICKRLTVLYFIGFLTTTA